MVSVQRVVAGDRDVALIARDFDKYAVSLRQVSGPSEHSVGAFLGRYFGALEAIQRLIPKKSQKKRNYLRSLPVKKVASPRGMLTI